MKSSAAVHSPKPSTGQLRLLIKRQNEMVISAATEKEDTGDDDGMHYYLNNPSFCTWQDEPLTEQDKEMFQTSPSTGGAAGSCKDKHHRLSQQHGSADHS